MGETVKISGTGFDWMNEQAARRDCEARARLDEWGDGMNQKSHVSLAASRPDWHILRRIYASSSLLRENCTVAEAAGIGSGRVVYLATPYSREVVDKRGDWRRDLHQSAVNVAGFWSWRLSYEGATAISPIICADHIQKNGRCSGKGPGPLDDDWWAMWCLPLMRVARCFAIPPIPGWDRSRGVWREACWALEHGVPVCLISAPGKGVK